MQRVYASPATLSLGRDMLRDRVAIAVRGVVVDREDVMLLVGRMDSYWLRRIVRWAHFDVLGGRLGAGAFGVSMKEATHDGGGGVRRCRWCCSSLLAFD